MSDVQAVIRRFGRGIGCLGSIGMSAANTRFSVVAGETERGRGVEGNGGDG